jgi:RimK family alpha-L-glutamate ligase
VWGQRELQVIIVYGQGLDKNNKQLFATCKKLTNKVICARAMDLSAYVGSNGNFFWHGDKELLQVDLCFLRSLGSGSFEQMIKRASIIEQMDLSGALVVNPVQAYRNARNKYLTMCILAKAGLPILSSYITEMAHWAYRISKGFRAVVCKPNSGSLGFGSMKFDNADLAFNAYTVLERLGQPLHVQEYMEKPGRDIRAFVLGEKILASIYRIARPTEWKTNVAQGAEARSIQLPSEVEELAIKATKSLGLAYAGVDILENEKRPVILEVNASPSWQGLLKATKINIAEELVQYAIDRMKN